MIGLLTKLPMIGSLLGTAFGALKKRPRLIMEYAMIIVVVGLCVATLNLWLSKHQFEMKLQNAASEIKTLSENVTALELVADEQEKEIKKLERARELDGKSIKNLVERLGTIKETEEGISGRLNALEKENETVKDFFNIHIPPELRRLPNVTPAGTEDNYTY